MSLAAPRFVVRRVVPDNVRRVLWGDRTRWGRDKDETDPDWIEWNAVMERFYDSSQRRGVGRWVNDAGYRIMREVDLEGAVLLELGPGTITHHADWSGRPKNVHLVDIDPRMAQRGATALEAIGVPVEVHQLESDARIPLPDESVDVVVTFYALEHVHPIRAQLDELKRVLVPGGVVVGAIPAEGGLAWGLGRSLTTRRWLRRHTSVDPDKIICWEHPNFADVVVRALLDVFDVDVLRPWPFRFLPTIDLNLVVKFRASKAHDDSRS